MHACELWRTLHRLQPFCDAPGAGTPWAVNMTKLLGPRCSGEVGDAACCFVPLSYDGGPACGVPCEEACAPRIGASSAFCQKSDRSNYGNCFCGGVSSAADGPDVVEAQSAQEAQLAELER